VKSKEYSDDGYVESILHDSLLLTLYSLRFLKCLANDNVVFSASTALRRNSGQAPQYENPNSSADHTPQRGQIDIVAHQADNLLTASRVWYDSRTEREHTPDGHLRKCSNNVRVGPGCSARIIDHVVDDNPTDRDAGGFGTAYCHQCVIYGSQVSSSHNKQRQIQKSDEIGNQQ